MQHRLEVLGRLIAADKVSRAFSQGDRSLPSWCLRLDVYREPDPDVLVASITLASTLRWLGVTALQDSGRLKKAWGELFEACQAGDVELCRYWQKEVSRLRSDFFGGDHSPGAGVPRRPVPPRSGSGSSLPLDPSL